MPPLGTAFGATRRTRVAESKHSRPPLFTRASLWQGVASVALLLVTLITTTAFGYNVVGSYRAGHLLHLDDLLAGYQVLWHHDPTFWRGLYFSGPLLAILLSHELGHYIACRNNGVEATLPFFLPSPFLLGTFGAFIRIRSPIYSRKQLFDIGVSGPIAGFLMILPFLILGSAWSKPIHGTVSEDTLAFGLPLAMRLSQWLTHGSVLEISVLHPFAVASWAGMLATAMNLLPMGQLDGGHIVYAAAGERWHKWLSAGFLLVLAALGFAYWAWWFWAVAMFFIGRRHPLVYDRTPINGARMSLAVCAGVLLVLCIAAVPVHLL